MQTTTRAVLGGATTVVGLVGVLVAVLTAWQQGPGSPPQRSAPATGAVQVSSCSTVSCGAIDRAPDEPWAVSPYPLR